MGKVGCFMAKIIFIILFIFPNFLLHAGESSLYDFSWLDPDKEVYVLQNRKFRKAKKIHMSAGYGMTTSGPFVDATSFQGRLSVFMHEEWGIEGIYAINNSDENDTYSTVLNPGGPGSIPFRRMVTDYKGVMLIWSPFYAKINTFNSIIYLDWMFGIGMASLTEENNAESFRAGVLGAPDTSESHSGLLWQTSFNVYLGQVTSLRIDLTAIHYEAVRPTVTASEEEFYYNFDLSASLGVRF